MVQRAPGDSPEHRQRLYERSSSGDIQITLPHEQQGQRHPCYRRLPQVDPIQGFFSVVTSAASFHFQELSERKGCWGLLQANGVPWDRGHHTAWSVPCIVS